MAGDVQIVIMFVVASHCVQGLTGHCCDGGNQYIWTFPGWFGPNWWDVPLSTTIGGNYTCTRDEMRKMVAHTITVEPRFYGPPESTVEISEDYNFTVREWVKQFTHILKTVSFR